MIKVNGDDDIKIWWEPESGKYFVKIDCEVSGKKMPLKIEAKPEWFVNMYNAFRRLLFRQ